MELGEECFSCFGQPFAFAFVCCVDVAGVVFGSVVSGAVVVVVP